ncbi:MAG: inositol monophosphatase family protein [Solirubrobacterales bacterium]
MTSEGGEHAAWLNACRRAVEAQRRIFAEHPGIAERTAYEGVGEGGDRALVIDRRCEDAVFEQLDALHAHGAQFTAISEERGEVSFGDSPTRVVIDPIDGSLNARRTVPLYCLSVAVAEGDSMADVVWGYVYDFGPGEEFVASRGGGATLDGKPMKVFEGPGLELVALEASKPERVIAAAERLRDRAYRLRAPGAIAISLSWVGAGRFDGMLTTRPCRSVDAAAAQLIASEAGAAVRFGELEAGQAGLDLDARFHVVGARDRSDLDTLLDAQSPFGSV